MSSDREDSRSTGEAAPEASRPVFFIGVVAELTGTHPQTLRNYERMGLLRPGRSQGSVRMFSSRDVERVRRIRRLTGRVRGDDAGPEHTQTVHGNEHRAVEERIECLDLPLSTTFD